MRAVLVSTDLMLLSAAQGAAERCGWELAVTADALAAASAGRDGGADVAAIDLRLPGLDVAALVAELRQAAPRPLHIMAFGPHVHEASLRAAAAAGCDEVFTRGEFERRFGGALAARGR